MFKWIIILIAELVMIVLLSDFMIMLRVPRLARSIILGLIVGGICVAVDRLKKEK